MKIGPLGPDDVDAALQLSTSEGWNQSAADWLRMIGLAPSGCFAARDGDRLIGTVTTTAYGRELAWIGMMLVDPEFRRRGIGEALMRAALDHLHGAGIRTVKLDATPAGRPLYETLEFVAETVMERWQGVPRTSAGKEVAAKPSRERLLAIDHAAYGLDRSRLLDALLESSVGDPIAIDGGYVLARRGRAAAYLGPVIAPDPAAAVTLLDAMLARLGGEEVCLDRHDGGALEAAALEARGFTKRRELTRMFHGEPNAVATSPVIAASSGPEFG